MVKRKYTKTPKAIAYYESLRGVPHGHKTSNGGGWKHTEESKKKMGGAVNKRLILNLIPAKPGNQLGVGNRGNTGKKPWNYIEDRTKLKMGRRHAYDTRYRDWMLKVKDRDSWRCKIQDPECNGRLEAHHILPWSKFPELRYEVKNGITLCRFHHPRKPSEEIRLSPYFNSLIVNET